MASAIRLFGHHPSRSILIVAALVALIPACSGKKSAGTKAILSGGKGFALVPARRFTVEKGSGPAFENSIRMMMLPVKCTSESEIVTLENFALASEDGLRYNGGAVFDSNGAQIPGTESCGVIGNYALHLWAAQDLFLGRPKSDDEYRKQQWLYLAFRGPFNVQRQGLRPPAVEKFFTEAGSMPFKSGGPALGAWDSFFNPCLSVDSSKNAGFDKNRYFKCEGNNYRSLAGNPDDRTLQMEIANASESMLYRISNREFAPLSTDGLEKAIRLSGAPGPGATFKSLTTAKSSNDSASQLQMKAGFVRGQPIRNLGRLLFGPSNGRMRRNYTPLYPGRYNTTPARTSYVPPQNPRVTPPTRPVALPEFRDAEADAYDGIVQDWAAAANKSDGINFFVENPDKLTSLKEYSQSSGRPISQILDPVLLNQAEAAMYGPAANSSESISLPVNPSDSGEIIKRLTGFGYVTSTDYSDWMRGPPGVNPGGVSVKDKQDGTSVTFWKNIATGAEEKSQTDSSGNTTWSVGDRVLAEYDPDGMQIGGDSIWNEETNEWERWK